MTAAPPAALIDGLPGEAVALQDRGLHYGDGLFETLRWERGQLRWFGRHMARLEQGCERLGIAAPDRALLRAEAESLTRSQPRAIIKLIVTRGTATRRGYRPAGDEQPTRIVCRYDWPAADPAAFRLGLSTVPLGRNPLLAGIKHLNRLEQVLAQQAAAAAGLHEVAMCASGGEVVCGSMSNLFIRHGQEWLTPPIDDCGVSGIVRALLLEAAPRLGLALRVAPLDAASLAASPAMFVTNVRLGVQAVNWYQGRSLAVAACCARLQEYLDVTEA
jgi:4-amino-4-deoxychorismate lyase